MKPELGLGMLVKGFHRQMDPGAFVSILSQLCVLNQLMQRDDEFAHIALSSAGAIRVPVGELLEAGLASLARQDASKPNEFINVDSPGWSLLPPVWINQVVEWLHESESSPERRGRWLLAQARSRLGRKRDFSREFLALIREFIRKAESVYLPFDAPALSILELTNRTQQVTLRPQSEQVYKLLQRTLFVARREGTLQDGNPYSRRGIPDTSLAVVIPPPGERIDRTLLQEDSRVLWAGKDLSLPEEFAVAAHAAEAGQHVLAFVPSGLLFRGGRSRTLREWLVDVMGLDSVIEFPTRCLRNTPIGCALLSIPSKRSPKSDSVRLVAADSSKFITKSWKSNRLSRGRELARVTLAPDPGNHEEVADVERAAIRENDYVLNPARYQTKVLDRLLEGSRAARLGTLCSIIFPVLTKDSREEPTMTYFEVLISDFEPDGTVAHGSKERLLDYPWVGKPKHELRPGDILLGIKGTIGKVAIVTEEADQNLLAGQTMVILRLEDRDRIPDPVYLLRYLSQPAVGKFLNAMAGGSAIRFVRRKDVANLPVPIGSLEQQAKVRELHVQIVDAIAEAHDCMEEARRLNESAFGA